MSDGTIERGIPIPADKRKSFEEIYPEICLLEIGDYFVVKDAPFGMHMGVAVFGLKNNRHHEVRKIDETKDDFMVWRTA